MHQTIATFTARNTTVWRDTHVSISGIKQIRGLISRHSVPSPEVKVFPDEIFLYSNSMVLQLQFRQVQTGCPGIEIELLG